MELIGDDQRLVAHVGAVSLRLLAERTGLTAGVSAAMRRRGFDPVYDRGQVLVDLALVLILGGEAISDVRSLAHLAPVIGPVPSTPTVWRALEETGELQVARINAGLPVAFRTSPPFDSRCLWGGFVSGVDFMRGPIGEP